MIEAIAAYEEKGPANPRFYNEAGLEVQLPDDILCLNFGHAFTVSAIVKYADAAIHPEVYSFYTLYQSSGAADIPHKNGWNRNGYVEINKKSLVVHLNEEEFLIIHVVQPTSFYVHPFTPQLLEQVKKATNDAREEGLKIIDIEDDNLERPIIMALPWLSPEEFDERTKDAKAITLVVFASGCSPDRLSEVIERKALSGVPVFLVSDNPADKAGIKKITYGAQMGALNAGAIPIQKVNVRELEILKAYIK